MNVLAIKRIVTAEKKHHYLTYITIMLAIPLFLPLSLRSQGMTRRKCLTA